MSANSARFGEVVTAMITPFDGDGRLDLDGAARLARWLADHGSQGLVVAGTTGEAPTLTDDEKRDLWRATAEAVTIPVIAGSGTNDTRHSVQLTKAAADAGAAAILAVGPYYNRPSQAGLDAHFRAVAAGAGRLPVVLYDVPFRTGRRIANDTTARLAREVANIVAIKDAANDVATTARLVADAPEGFEVYSGSDDQTLAMLAVGAVGVVSVASHWAGEEIAAMIADFHKGDVEGARQRNARLLESWEFESGDAAPNPIPTKVMLAALGQPVGQCRLPMGPPPEGLEARARQVLANLRG
jgi:4-hydroxy-tetrahydrodipicolinate synthase